MDILSSDFFFLSLWYSFQPVSHIAKPLKRTPAITSIIAWQNHAYYLVFSLFWWSIGSMSSTSYTNYTCSVSIIIPFCFVTIINSYPNQNITNCNTSDNSNINTRQFDVSAGWYSSWPCIVDVAINMDNIWSTNCFWLTLIVKQTQIII